MRILDDPVTVNRGIPLNDPIALPILNVRRGAGVTICKSETCLVFEMGFRVKSNIQSDTIPQVSQRCQPWVGRQFYYDYDCMHLEHINIHEQYLLLKGRNSASALSM